MEKDPYADLREKLESDFSWPSVYLFKFIIPASHQKLAKTQLLFGPEAEVSIKTSNKGNYISVSARELMLSADEVIKKYEEAGKIKGLMAL